MKFRKSSIDETILWVGLIIGVLIIGTWFIGFIGQQSINEQNLVLSTLTLSASYIQLACDFSEVEISGIKVESINTATLIVSESRVCLESSNFVRQCVPLFCESQIETVEFNLRNTNFLSISKSEGGEVNVIFN